jgi:hypothetical protein
MPSACAFFVVTAETTCSSPLGLNWTYSVPASTSGCGPRGHRRRRRPRDQPRRRAVPCTRRRPSRHQSVPKTCPQHPTIFLATDAHPPDTRIQAISCAAGIRADGTALPFREVLYSVTRGNKKAAICSGFVFLREPSDGLEPSTPSLPWRIRASARRPEQCLRARSSCITASSSASASLSRDALSLPEKP